GKIIANEAMTFGEGLVDHLLVSVKIAGQWLRDKDVSIHGFEMEYIREDHAVQWTHVHMHRVRVRAAEGNDSATGGEKLIPAHQRFRNRLMPNELWKEGIEEPMQFSWNNSLKFTESIPQFNAVKALYIPSLPGNIIFMESGCFRVFRMCDETDT